MQARLVIAIVLTCACGDPLVPPLALDAGSGFDGGAGDANAPWNAIELSPATFLGFLPTLVGGETDATLTVTARADVTDLAPHITRAGFAITGTDCAPTLTAGSACRIDLAFRPLSQGVFNSSTSLVLTFGTEAGAGEVDYELVGLAVVPEHAPGLVVATELRMPPTVLGESQTIQIPVTNTGATIAAVGVDVPPTAGFDIKVDPSCAPFVLPGGGCSLDVTFTPQAWGCTWATFKVNFNDPWSTVRACAARREDRGRAMISGIGPLLPDGDGFVFTDEPATWYPGPGRVPGEVHRVLANGTLDPSFGDRGTLAIGTALQYAQRLRVLAPGRFLWFADVPGGTDLAIVEGGTVGPIAHLVGCNAVDAAVSDSGAIGVLCGGFDVAGTIATLRPDLSEDTSFGRAVVFTPVTGIEMQTLSIAFDGPARRWVASTLTYSDFDLHLLVAAVDLAGRVDGRFAQQLPDVYTPDTMPKLVVGTDGAVYVIGAVDVGSAHEFGVARIAPDGRLDPGFGGGSVALPLERSDEHLEASFVPLAPSGDDRIAFLAQLLRFEGSTFAGARWVEVACDAVAVCHTDERLPLQPDTTPIVAQDGARWLAAGWGGGRTFNWTYVTIAIKAFTADGHVDPGFANDDDVTTPSPGGVAPWRVKADAGGRFYVAAHDVIGQHRQPVVTRYDASGVIDPGFAFRLPVRAPEAALFWDLVGSAGGESLSGRNLDLDVRPDGGGMLASFDGNARTVTLAAFTPAGALDASFGDGGQRVFAFALDDDAMRGGPFGIILVRVADGSYWTSINSSVGLVRHVSASGAPLGDWIQPGVGSISALLPSGDALRVIGQLGSVELEGNGAIVPIGGAAGANAVVVASADGGYYIAAPCVARFMADGKLADGRHGPVFGDNGRACSHEVSLYDAARSLVVQADGSLDLYTATHHAHFSADGQVEREDSVAPDLFRDLATTPDETFVVARDSQSRLILTSW